VRALDVGAVGADGRLVSLAHSGELYLLTTWAPGHPYADDLRRVARTLRATPEDAARCDALAAYLAALHEAPVEQHAAYVRSVRDLVGSGEGISGIIDGYGSAVPGAPEKRLEAIERRCQAWRWRLRRRASRLRRIHGDFHPFNIVFDEGVRFALLDASRGCLGDPADDVTALAVNYIFFALDAPAAWADGLGPLWRRFWSTYLERRPDEELLACLAPYLAWRGLVVCCPRFYPALSEAGRDRLLGLVERALDAPRFDPAWAEELFE
jgi:aminoglycoside phosphotransferase (APT) family kinase protein